MVPGSSPGRGADWTGSERPVRILKSIANSMLFGFSFCFIEMSILVLSPYKFIFLVFSRYFGSSPVISQLSFFLDF